MPAFRIDTQNVTNREFLRFVNEGGYQERSLWSEADWEWLRASGTSHPGFWIRRESASGEEWGYRTMFDVRPLPLEWPVYVSHAEATAYARWRGKELPSEAEWHRAALGTPNGVEREYPWGDELPDSSRGNFDSYRWDPTDVGSFPEGRERVWSFRSCGQRVGVDADTFRAARGVRALPVLCGIFGEFF